ncbi:hypothetical protein A0U92_15450 [Acetobacter aceti]|uniref:Uncharacterized protein n=1 Tax=Acetobacter aceti TaxID=435 RepID=A0A1U9KJK8_ACEAC|nr:hypothetical protein A0U92_15450 [Acetobacter aceti]
MGSPGYRRVVQILAFGGITRWGAVSWPMWEYHYSVQLGERRHLRPRAHGSDALGYDIMTSVREFVQMSGPWYIKRITDFQDLRVWSS